MQCSCRNSSSLTQFSGKLGGGEGGGTGGPAGEEDGGWAEGKGQAEWGKQQRDALARH